MLFISRIFGDIDSNKNVSFKTHTFQNIITKKNYEVINVFPRVSWNLIINNIIPGPVAQ